MRTPNQIRFIQACVRHGISYRLYDGPIVKDIYCPDYYIDTNGMTCIVECESVWNSTVTLEEACAALPNFYMMTARNLLLVERGHFRFIPLELDERRSRRLIELIRLLEEISGKELGEVG